MARTVNRYNSIPICTRSIVTPNQWPTVITTQDNSQFRKPQSITHNNYSHFHQNSCVHVSSVGVSHGTLFRTPPRHSRHVHANDALRKTLTSHLISCELHTTQDVIRVSPIIMQPTLVPCKRHSHVHRFLMKCRITRVNFTDFMQVTNYALRHSHFHRCHIRKKWRHSHFYPYHTRKEQWRHPSFHRYHTKKEQWRHSHFHRYKQTKTKNKTERRRKGTQLNL